MDIFLTERLMGLFWVTVQAGAFAAVKYAWLAAFDSRTENGRNGNVGAAWPDIRRAVSAPALGLALIFAASFLSEIHPSAVLIFTIRGVSYWPWAVRIMLCGAMIYHDAMLVLYFSRIVRRYHGAGPIYTRAADAAVLILTAALTAGYIYYSVCDSSASGFSMLEYVWIGRFFILISNVFYVALETAGAFMMRRFYIKLRWEANK